MTLIVGLSTIVFFIFGYYVIDNIDKFIEKRINVPNKNLSYEEIRDKGEAESIILIYGKNELTELVEAYCNSQKYVYQSITDISCINTNNKYRCLFTLSYNDADNLTMSSIGFKIYSIPNITALCSNQGNLKIYKEFSINNILLYDDTDKIFGIIKGLIEDGNKIKNKV